MVICSTLKAKTFTWKNRIWEFLEQISWKKLLPIQNKFYFHVKKLSQTTKIQEKTYSLNHISGPCLNQKRV